MSSPFPRGDSIAGLSSEISDLDLRFRVLSGEVVEGGDRERGGRGG